eukprot:TRINITY_DN68583_c0_g1_i1.p1 TRINITY_DN68583_c0_g1~~TRINITY_DN68583_c0_g1_i1.p1  ORF type:complete len:819 (+),score=97.51 TRINITY_DN68583_c0_g1_i1:46-2502(+)
MFLVMQGRHGRSLPRVTALGAWVFMLPGPARAYDPECWKGVRPEVEAACCSNSNSLPVDLATCFDAVYTYDRCCKSASSDDGSLTVQKQMEMWKPSASRPRCVMQELCCDGGRTCELYKVCGALQFNFYRSDDDVTKPVTCARNNDALIVPKRLDEVHGDPLGPALSMSGALFPSSGFLLATNPWTPRTCMEAYYQLPESGLWLLERDRIWDHLRRCWAAAPSCVTHAMRVNMLDLHNRKHVWDAVVAVPSSCSSLDVALKVMPHAMEIALKGSPFLVQGVRLHRIVHSDECLRWSATRPSAAIPLVVSVILLAPWFLLRLAGLREWLRRRRWQLRADDAELEANKDSFNPVPAVDTTTTAAVVAPTALVTAAQASARPLADPTTGCSVDALRVFALWTVRSSHHIEALPIRFIATGLCEYVWQDQYIMLCVRRQGDVSGSASVSLAALASTSRKLLRKVARQSATAFFLVVWIPVVTHVASPMHCLQAAGPLEQEPPTGSFVGKLATWAMRVVTMTQIRLLWEWPGSYSDPLHWPTYVWMVELEMRIYLSMAVFGWIEAQFPRASAAFAMAYGAFTVQTGRTPGFCGSTKDFKYSFAFFRFPVALSVFYADRFFRTSTWFHRSVRAAPTFWAVATFVMLILTWVASFTLADLPVWEQLGFFCGNTNLDMRQLFLSMPMTMVALAFSHVPLSLPSTMTAVLRFISRVSLPIMFGHQIVKKSLLKHFPVWGYARARNTDTDTGPGLLEDLLLFVPPLLALESIVALGVQDMVADPWATVANRVSRQPRVAVGLAVLYAVGCVCWWYLDSVHGLHTSPRN